MKLATVATIIGIGAGLPAAGTGIALGWSHVSDHFGQVAANTRYVKRSQHNRLNDIRKDQGLTEDQYRWFCDLRADLRYRGPCPPRKPQRQFQPRRPPR